MPGLTAVAKDSGALVFLRRQAVILKCFVAAFTLLGVLPTSADDDALTRRALDARLARLQNITMTYRQHEETYSNLPNMVTVEGTVLNSDDAPREKECRLAFHEGDILYDVRITDPYVHLVRSGGIAEAFRSIRLMTCEQEQKLIRFTPEHEYLGNIQDPSNPPTSLVVHVALGLGVPHSKVVWFTSEILDESEVRATSSGDVEVTWVDSKGSTHRWSFSTGTGLALERYSLRPYGRAFESLVIENADFRVVEGVALPFHIVQTRHREIDGQSVLTHKTRIQVDSYWLDRSEDADLRIAWPLGALVYDARSGVIYEGDETGALREVSVPRTAADARRGEPRGDAQQMATTQVPTESAGERVRWWFGWAAIAVGVIAGALAFAMRHHAFLRRRGRRLSCASAWICACCLLAFGQDSSACDGTGVPQEDMQDPGKQIEQYRAQVAARRARFIRRASEVILDRLARDLVLRSDQRDICRELLARFVDEREAASAEYRDAMERWKKEYWAERLPREKDVVQFPGDTSTVGWKRVRSREDADGVVHYTLTPLEDDPAYQEARLQNSARIRTEIRTRFSVAFDVMIGEITAILDEPQLELWIPRGKRRLWIALHDAMSPRSGGRPNWDVDMLGLIDEAAAPGGELEPFAGQIGVGLHDSAEDGRSGEIRRIIAAFETSYAAALRSYLQAQDRMYERRSDDMGEGNGRTARASDRRLRAARSVWNVRLACLRDIERVLRESKGDDAADRWNQRFFARCVPFLFEPDGVDRLSESVAAEEAILPAGTIEAVHAMLVDYEDQRRRLRCGLALAYIELRNADMDDRSKIDEDRAVKHEMIRALEARTMIALQALLPEGFGETSRSADTEDRGDRGGRE